MKAFIRIIVISFDQPIIITIISILTIIGMNVSLNYNLIVITKQ